MRQQLLVAVLALIASALLSMHAGAAEFFLPTAGPYGEWARQIALAPDGDLVALSAQYPANVYSMQSDSDSWSRVGTTLPPGIQQIEVAPNGRIWAFDIVGQSTSYVSVDGGTTWQMAPGALPAISALAFMAPGLMFAGMANGLYRSQDGGNSWVLLGLPQTQVDEIYADQNVLWAALGTDLHRSEDAGANWAHFANLPLRASAMASHPDGGLYIGLDRPNGTTTGGGIYRVTPGGAVSFVGLDGHHVRKLLVRADRRVVVSSHGVCVYGCYENGIFTSTNDGQPGATPFRTRSPRISCNAAMGRCSP